MERSQRGSGEVESLCPICCRVSQAAFAAKSIFARHGISTPDCFVGLGFCGSAYTPQQFASAVREQVGVLRKDADAKSAICEAMVHPGFLPGDDRAAWDAFDADPKRQTELSTLCDPALAGLLSPFVRLQSQHLVPSPVRPDAARSPLDAHFFYKKPIKNLKPMAGT